MTKLIDLYKEFLEQLSYGVDGDAFSLISIVVRLPLIILFLIFQKKRAVFGNMKYSKIQPQYFLKRGFNSFIILSETYN